MPLLQSNYQKLRIMILDSIETDSQQQNVSEYLWTQNMTFLSVQQDVLKNNVSESPFMACWKIFQIYNSGQIPTASNEESEISTSCEVSIPQNTEVRKTKKILKKNKSINKKTCSKKLQISV